MNYKLPHTSFLAVLKLHLKKDIELWEFSFTVNSDRTS